jgi:hypothetical protein
MATAGCICRRAVFFLSQKSQIVCVEYHSKKIIEQSLLEAMYTNDDAESGMLDFIRMIRSFHCIYQSFSYT